ncbi:spore coat protein [Bacillus massiliglaciei]|uniref:spore coat protein n=1 Tax=Bacillus massiliglaciei TaxID=1816693 RepID=UPI002D21DD03|nr:spore coat protein [Bacillus massiliglaciei]
MVSISFQVIATNFLISAKSGIRNLTFAITETADPELKSAFLEHLETAVYTHQSITKYMMNKGFYHPYNLIEQNTMIKKLPRQL